MNEDELCRAFCNEIFVKEVPAGLAVSTPFRRSDGDAVGFYVISNKSLPGLAHIEDDGTTIPYLQACGVDFETQTRRKALEVLLSEHHAEYDEVEGLIRTPDMRQEEIPGAALRFVALLLRLTDFLLLREEHVESTFKEDATVTVREGELLGPVDWGHELAKDKPAIWREAAEKPDDFTLNGRTIISIGMYDGWPYWKPMPAILFIGPINSAEWAHFNSYGVTDQSIQRRKP